MLTPDKLVRWVSAAIADLTEGGLPDRFELFHTVEGHPPELLGKVSCGDEADAEDVAGRLYQVAMDDAATRGGSGPERYVAQSMQGDDLLGKSAFLVGSEVKARLKSGGVEVGMSSEPGDDEGAMSQMRRHLENMLQLTQRANSELLGQATRELSMQRERAIQAESKLLSMYEAHQDLLDRTQERDLERARAQRREDRQDKILSMLVAMAPGIVTQLGIKSAPAADQTVAKFSESVGGLSAEESEAVMTALSPQNAEKLLGLLAGKTEMETH